MIRFKLLENNKMNVLFFFFLMLKIENIYIIKEYIKNKRKIVIKMFEYKVFILLFFILYFITYVNCACIGDYCVCFCKGRTDGPCADC